MGSYFAKMWRRLNVTDSHYCKSIFFSLNHVKKVYFCYQKVTYGGNNLLE